MQRRNFLTAFAAAATAGAAPISFIETNDRTTLFHKDWGTGRPVVFLHGWALNSDMWQYQMIHLANQGFRCIAYDRRGHGRSSDPGRGYDYDTLAGDLASVMERLDLRDAVLVGHSMGAGEVVRYLTRYGTKRVSRALLVAPSLPFILKTEDNPDGVDKSLLDTFRAQICRDFPKWLADNAPPFFLPETSPEMVQWAVRMALQASLKALVDANRTDTEADFRPEMRKIATPTLIIHGDRDHSAPLDFTGRRTAKLIPGSELKVYEGAPHGLFITHMERLNRDLLAFVKG